MSLDSLGNDPPRLRSAFGTPSLRGDRWVWIVLGYSFAGLLIIVLSGLTKRIYQVPVDAQLGLFQLLPPAYWIGLSLMAVATALSVWRKSDGLTAITGVLLLATLSGTPTFFEPVPRYWDAYSHFAEAQQLTWTGNLSAFADAYSANWPGAFLVMWVFASAGGIAPLDFLGLYPFVTGGITFLAIFELLRSTFGAKIAREASVPTALFTVWAQYHVSPQSIGFVLFLLILATWQQKETRWRLLAATLFVGLVVSHPTSAILLLTVLIFNAGVSHIGKRRGQPARDEARRRSWFPTRVAVTYAIVWLAWLFFLAVGSSDAARTAILNKMDMILGVPEQTLNLATHRTVDNPLTLAPRIRTASLGIYGVFGLVSLVALFRDRLSRDLFRMILCTLIGAAFVAVADIFAFGGQFYDRSLLLLGTFLPALCFAGLSRIRIPANVRRAVVVALVCASVATASTAYYLEAFNIVTPEAVAGANFVNTLPPSSVVVDGKLPAMVWIPPDERVHVTHTTFADLRQTPLDSLDPGLPVYAIYDPTAALWYRQWYGADLYRSYYDARTNYSLIYDNGWTTVFAVHD